MQLLGRFDVYLDDQAEDVCASFLSTFDSCLWLLLLFAVAFSGCTVELPRIFEGRVFVARGTNQ